MYKNNLMLNIRNYNREKNNKVFICTTETANFGGLLILQRYTQQQKGLLNLKIATRDTSESWIDSPLISESGESGKKEKNH